MARIIGLLISGATVRLAGAGMALYIAYTVGTYVVDTMTHVSTALNVLGN